MKMKKSRRNTTGNLKRCPRKEKWRSHSPPKPYLSTRTVVLKRHHINDGRSEKTLLRHVSPRNDYHWKDLWFQVTSSAHKATHAFIKESSSSTCMTWISQNRSYTRFKTSGFPQKAQVTNLSNNTPIHSGPLGCHPYAVGFLAKICQEHIFSSKLSVAG